MPTPPNTKAGVGTLVLTTTYGYNAADQMNTRSEVGPNGSAINGFTYNYQYDANGSLTSETNTASGGEVTSYTYDTRNRLTQVQKQVKGQNLSTATMQYDGKNTRLSMSYSGKTTSYLQDVAVGLPVALQETVGSQAPSSFMYPLGSTSPMYQTDPNNAGMWYHADGLGSVRVLTDGSTGAIISSNSYSAFGLNVGATGKAANSHGFAGEQLDPTGLYFNRARYYSPSLGRFIGRDDYSGQLQWPGSLNRYDYVLNNPVNLIDPGGNRPVEQQVTAVACSVALSLNLEPVCDVSSKALAFLINGFFAAVNPNQGGDKTQIGNTRPNWGSGRNVTINTQANQVDIATLRDVPKIVYNYKWDAENDNSDGDGDYL